MVVGGAAESKSLLVVRFEAAKLVMQWLCNHEDQNMQRMAVAIISILAAKVNARRASSPGARLSRLTRVSISGAAVHRADGSAGSGDVHREGELLPPAFAPLQIFLTPPPLPQQLLHIVRQKATQVMVDATLKFTLSALWNLTDESPTTCRHFIENQGLELFIKVLEVHANATGVCSRTFLHSFFLMMRCCVYACAFGSV